MNRSPFRLRQGRGEGESFCLDMVYNKVGILLTAEGTEAQREDKKSVCWGWLLLPVYSKIPVGNKEKCCLAQLQDCLGWVKVGLAPLGE
jgi:hypothetical protein